jgi:hypothetical protein
MGIPYYFYSLTKKYQDILHNNKPKNTDIYCIDFNDAPIPPCRHNIFYYATAAKGSQSNNLFIRLKTDPWLSGYSSSLSAH